MNLKKLQYINEIMIEQMNHWIFFPIALYFMGVNKFAWGINKPDVLLWAICGLLPLGLFLLRIKSKKNSRHITCIIEHAAVAGGIIGAAWLMHFTMNIVIIIGCVIVYTLYSLHLCIKKESVFSNATPLSIGLVLSLVLSALRRYDDWTDYYIVAMIGVMALFSVIFYMQHYMDFLSVNKSSAGFLPASEMFRSGLGLVIGFTLFGLALFVIVTQFNWLSNLLQPVKELFKNVFEYIMKLLLKFLGMASSSDTGLDVGEVSAPAIGEIPENGGFWLWELLEYVGLVAIIGGLVFAAVKLLIKLMQFLQSYLTRRQPGQEDLEEEVFDLREKCDIEQSIGRKKPDLFGFLSYREQVRRLYKKKVIASSSRMSTGDKDRQGIYTAREWEKKLEISGMAEIYEQARYTKREITGTDVKKMKEICRHGNVEKIEV